MDINSIGSFFLHLPVDWVVFVVLIVLLGADALRGTSRRAAALALAFLITPVLIAALQHAFFVEKLLSALPSQWATLLLFAIVLVLSFVFLLRMMGSAGFESIGPLSALLAGAGATVIIAIVWLQTPALMSLWHIGSQLQNIFAEQWRFWWFLGSLAALAFARD